MVRTQTEWALKMSQIDNEVIDKEIAIQRSINGCVDEYTSFRFNAGAGAGKTYALIETIRHIIQTKHSALSKLNQQVICITYTNVAVKEIRKRLGESELVIVSTIHERLWELIKIHQPELLKIHQKKLETELDKLDVELSNKEDKTYQVYAALSGDDQQAFFEFMLENKDTFYKSVDLVSDAFRTKINSLENKPACLTSLLKNKANFVKTARSVLRRKRYQDGLLRINEGREKHVDYDSLSNSDRLEYMRFSHDTLLEYAAKLVESYPLLSRLIVDKHPFILVDEYQDTNGNVIRILNALDTYAKQYNLDFLVGYFGDVAQNIYEDGIGSQISTLHSNLQTITKIFNRRSHFQVIELINKIRSDNVVQEPISQAKNQGSVEFYSKICATDAEKLSVAQDFIAWYASALGEDKLHCLVLTNKIMARLNGFGDLYDAIYQAGAIDWRDINTKLLSNELEKLDPKVLLIYRLVNWYKKTQNERAVLNDFIGNSDVKLNLGQAVKLAKDIRNNKASNLKELKAIFFTLIKNNEIEKNIRLSLLNQVVPQNHQTDLDNFESMFDLNVRDLLIKNQDEPTETDPVEQFYSLPFEQFSLWVDFINRVETNQTIYHTYHGTKGEEYDNVAIIMEHSFGTQCRDKFKNYFKVQQLEDKNNEHIHATCKSLDEYENTKNLMYVACSRAIKNLKILYLDDVSEIEQGIKKTFGEIKQSPV